VFDSSVAEITRTYLNSSDLELRLALNFSPSPYINRFPSDNMISMCRVLSEQHNIDFVEVVIEAVLKKISPQLCCNDKPSDLKKNEEK
jgi:hypothetical protein